jgi:uracil-DNA glycosylase family 4
MRIEPDFIECNCGATTCPAFSRCCFLPTEVHPGIDGKVSLLFIGQGGGTNERKKKRPFIGLAGKRIRHQVLYVRKKLGKQIGVAFSNTIRDNPEDNRAPSFLELNACIPLLYRDIALLKKRGLQVIIPLGYSAKTAIIRDRKVSISSDRGKVFQIKNPIFGEINAVPTYHPSYVMRQAYFFDADNLTPYDTIVIQDIIKAYEVACGLETGDTEENIQI